LPPTKPDVKNVPERKTPRNVARGGVFLKKGKGVEVENKTNTD